MKKISIAISTISSRLNNLALEKHTNVEYVIVHQKYDESSPDAVKNLKDRDDVIYIPLDTPGLSASRNVAILNSTGDYILIMDDDVTFSMYKIFHLIKKMQSEGIDIGTYYHSYQGGGSTMKTAKEIKLNFLTIAKPSSIDICVNRQAIQKNNILFDESFGLGTKHPSGEEMIFLSDCLKSGLSIKRYPLEICEHPPITSGSDFYSTKNKIKAKHAMFNRISHRLGNILFMLFVIKKLPKAHNAGHGIFFIRQAFNCISEKNNE